MEVIRDYKQLKQVVSHNYDYICVGFTKSNLFNLTHEHLYNQASLYLPSSNKNKLFGMIWDNAYDVQFFQGIQSPVPSSSIDEQLIIDWFANKGFEYLFLPSSTFITDFMNLPMFPQLMDEIDQIWINENYDRFLTDWVRQGNTDWIKLVFSRHYFVFSSRFDKLINRTYQPIAPDGTWGFLYRHFLAKYCGGNYPMVPLIRNEDGTPFDVKIEVYPQEVKNLISQFPPSFNKFRQERDLNLLISEITEIINRFDKFRYMQFQLIDFTYFKDPEITFDKYIFKIQFRNNYLRDNGQYDMFRYWDYDSGI